MKRTIIKIDEEKCTGCGLCVPNCHEGALQIIDKKAVLVSDLLCDGLGACLGYCPEGALQMEEREAEPYDETKVMSEMIRKGKNVVTAHLKHLKEHGESEYLKQGISFLHLHKERAGFDIADVIDAVHLTQARKQQSASSVLSQGNIPDKQECPGSRTHSFKLPPVSPVKESSGSSSLTQWPVQMHLINPEAALFKGADLLIAADCVAYATGNFHRQFLQGKKLAIACPKLDTNKEVYLDKVMRLIDKAEVKTITVMMMEVPCCGGLLRLVMDAAGRASRKVPVNTITIGIQGNLLSEEHL